MAAPDMATVTASIERSLQNFSLDHHHHHSSSSSSNSGGGVGAGRSSTSDSPENLDLSNNSLELNSGIPLPYYWEQCLDLKTGDIYFINWRTGMKSQVDPRTNAEGEGEGDFYSGDETSYDGEGLSSESTPSSREQCQYNNRPLSLSSGNNKSQQQVLVVAGCKSCFMYFMVPKQVEDCPKCCGQLLHFDRSENGSP